MRVRIRQQHTSYAAHCASVGSKSLLMAPPRPTLEKRVGILVGSPIRANSIELLSQKCQAHLRG
jgi:hypothetical protein